MAMSAMESDELYPIPKEYAHPAVRRIWGNIRAVHATVRRATWKRLRKALDDDERRHRVRTSVVRISQAAWPRTILRQLCLLGTWIVGRRLASIPGVESVYVRHSHPGSVTFAPGQSDLDLTLVLNDADGRDPSVVCTCTERIDSLNRLFYFVWPQDARFVTRRELAQMETAPGATEILNAPKQWIRIGGREVRRADLPSAPQTDSIALHPEFDAWWLNVLQTHVLTPQTTFAEQNMRLCFRVAMKNQFQLQAARRRVDLATEAYLPDSKAATLFADDTEMADILANIKRRDFRALEGDEEKSEILRHCIAGATDFYRELPVPPGMAWVAPTVDKPAAVAEAHRSELQQRFEQEGSLRAIADTIIIYPTPHWSPREYQIDVILREDFSPAEFRDAVRAIKTSFGGRTFGIGGTHAQITLVPRNAFEHPWFFLGTPFPFLHEHVAAFAETLMGSPPRIPAPPSRAERLCWLTRHYLFHRFTLGRRVNYFSKDCNSCQLASVHLFLERGTILTDAAEVHREYLELFGKDSEDAETLGFLLGIGGKTPDEEGKAPFAAALRIQARQYDAIEALLRRDGALA